MPQIRCPAGPACDTTFDSTLDKDILKTLIDGHLSRVHPLPATPASTSQASTPKPERVKRPVVASGGTSAMWNYFDTRWVEYKAAMHLPATNDTSEGSPQLMECCTDELRELVTNRFGSVVKLTEQDVLAKIKYFALRGENIMVERDVLRSMAQDRNENTRAFVARLRAQANVCQYSKTCSCAQNVDYSEDEVLGTLVAGLYDQEIKLELLGHANQKMSLEEVITFVEAKESGRRAASRFASAPASVALASPSPSASAVSSYKKSSKQEATAKGKAVKRKCGHCGGHCGALNSSTKARKEANCPALGSQCKKCGKMNHFESSCKATEVNALDAEDAAEQLATFNAVCSVQTDSDAGGKFF